MLFNMTPEEAKQKWKQYFRYELHKENYIIQVYEDTDASCGFLDKSDCIILFNDRTNTMCACIERIEKKDFSLFKRLQILWRGHRQRSLMEHGIDFYTYNRGEFIEYQMFKRWWYDIAHDNGDFFKFTP